MADSAMVRLAEGSCDVGFIKNKCACQGLTTSKVRWQQREIDTNESVIVNLEGSLSIRLRTVPCSPSARKCRGKRDNAPTAVFGCIYIAGCLSWYMSGFATDLDKPDLGRQGPVSAFENMH